MTLNTNVTGIGGFTPDSYGPLIEQPVARDSVAWNASTVVQTGATRMNFPLVTADPLAGWTAEGAEITPSDPAVDELTVTPAKVAGLTAVSAELAKDSNPAAARVVGDGLARQIAKSIDAAYFGTTTTDGPDGLASLAGVGVVDDGAGSPVAVSNLDPFAQAISQAEQAGAVLTTFAANPADVLALAQLKDETDSNRPLLGTDPTNPSRRLVFGVSLVPSPAVAAGTVWGIPRDSVYLVHREGTEVTTDESVYFTSHRIAVRGIMRVGFGFVHEAAIQRVDVTTS